MSRSRAQRQAERIALADPAVRLALEVLEAELVDVELLAPPPAALEAAAEQASLFGGASASEAAS